MALQLAYDSALDAVLLATDRRDRLDRTIAQLATDPAWAPLTSRLQCLRGVSILTALGLAVEVGDWTRFTGSSLGAFLGLVPTESSSGASRSQGSITKSGNSHARPAPTLSRRRSCAHQLRNSGIRTRRCLTRTANSASDLRKCVSDQR